ncbi:MAG: hypothetical protein HRU17_23700 [Polyangiaceae bacterium]|nr:hypothetical protein [Polyangiaceae bacterium]
MGIRTRSIVLGLLLTAGAVNSAVADTSRLPVEHVKRDMVTPKGTLQIHGGPDWPLRSGQLSFLAHDGPNRGRLNAGASFGVMDKLDVGLVMPMAFAPDLDAHSPTLFGTYSFSKQADYEVGAFGALMLPIEGDVALHAGLPVMLNSGGAFRIDTGVFLSFYTAGANRVDLEVPLTVPIQTTRWAYVGPEVAIRLEGIDDRMRVPLGVFGGFTLDPNDQLLGDIEAHFRFPHAGSAFDAFEILVSANLYFDLGG